VVVVVESPINEVRGGEYNKKRDHIFHINDDGG
jgi:hypothetical protein